MHQVLQSGFSVSLNSAECRLLYELIDELTGRNADQILTVADYDERNPRDQLLLKIWTCAGKPVPLGS